MLLGVITIFVAGNANAQITRVESVYPYSQNTFNQPYFQNNTLVNTVIVGMPAAQAVGTTTCTNYMSTFNKLNSSGGDVAKLQFFLNDYNGAKLNGKGYYGNVTTQEVKNLQYAYGLPVTGNQYRLTTALINNIKCGVIANKQRVVYKPTISVKTNQTIYYAPSSNSVTSVSEKIKVTESKVAKIIAQNIVDSQKNKENRESLKMDLDKTKLEFATFTKTTSTSFSSTLSSEFKNLKENYKSYLVVFFLVLALFWFLRKTATE